MTNHNEKTGAPPGTIIFTGEQKIAVTAIHYVEYNHEEIRVKQLEKNVASFHNPVEEYMQWYDVRGLHDIAIIEEIGRIFSVHPLALEDIANTLQRPKFDDYKQGNFISIKALDFDEENKSLSTEQISIYFGDGFLLSFQEKEEDLFVKLRERLENALGRVRGKKTDYLAYALIDVVVDQYFIVLEKMEEWIESLEIEILEFSKAGHKAQIHHLKQEMLAIRKAVAPMRETVGRFSRAENALIGEDTLLYLRDLYDHCLVSIDTIDTCRDNLNSLQDLYMSEISLRMNRVMQLLAVVTTIFVPLSFLAGLYGMNFDNIPELHYENGYFMLLGAMATIALGLMYFFWKKRWLE